MADNEAPHVSASAAEIALGILPDPERRRAEAHLRECAACQAEVDAFRPAASRLVDLVPGTEPPLGFDRRVLAAVAPTGGRRRLDPRNSPRRAALLGLAAAAAMLFATIGWMAGRGSSHHEPNAAVAEFVSSGNDVGRLEAYGDPAWLNVSVHGTGTNGKVTCEVFYRDGRVTTMGSFVLENGTGSWSVADPAGMKGVAGARLIDASGNVVAEARIS